MADLPVLGTAITLPGIAGLRDWILDSDRTVEFQDFVTPEAITADPADLVAALNAALDGHQGARGIHGPFFGLDLANADREMRAVVTRRLLTGLQIAEALRADHMVVHSPFTWWHELNLVNYPFVRPTMYEAIADCLAPVLARAADTGCTVMLENIDDAHPQARLGVIEAIDHPRLMASVDTGHAELAHRLYRAMPVGDHVTSMGARLGHVHLQDVDGYADRHWHPGDGCVPFAAVFEALAASPARPRLILEVRRDLVRLPATVAAMQARGWAQ